MTARSWSAGRRHRSAAAAPHRRSATQLPEIRAQTVEDQLNFLYSGASGAAEGPTFRKLCSDLGGRALSAGSCAQREPYLLEMGQAGAPVTAVDLQPTSAANGHSGHRQGMGQVRARAAFASAAVNSRSWRWSGFGLAAANFRGWRWSGFGSVQSTFGVGGGGHASGWRQPAFGGGGSQTSEPVTVGLRARDSQGEWARARALADELSGRLPPRMGRGDNRRNGGSAEFKMA